MLEGILSLIVIVIGVVIVALLVYLFIKGSVDAERHKKAYSENDYEALATMYEGEPRWNKTDETEKLAKYFRKLADEEKQNNS